MPRVTGGCLCGAVRYESDAEPALVAVCHCASCHTGSAFSVNLGMPADSVTIAVTCPLEPVIRSESPGC
jgi:hypothetical protein